MRSVNPLRLVRPHERAPAPSRRELPLEAQVLLIVTICLAVFGQLMVYSASSAYAMTHAEFNFDSLYFVKAGVVYTVAGIGLMLGMIFVPAGWLRRVAPLVFIAALIGLAAVRVPGIGITTNGAARWLAIGPLTVQPSEFAKLGTLLVVAVILANRKRPPETIKELLMPLGVLVGLVCALIMIQPDLGTTLAVVLMVFALLVAVGTRTLLLGKVLAIGLAVGGILIYAAPYRRDRIFAFLDPWGQSADGAYQVVQSMIAIGSGGVFGVGLGGSVQKVNFLPEAHTDMIFAVIGEELGLIGAVIVIGLFAAFAWAGYTIAMRTRDPFQRLLATGATALIVGQAIINLGAVMGILPLTGIPLPLLSYGSSSRLVILALVGILIAISREPQLAPRAERPPRREPDEPKPPTRRRRQPVGV
ncbi:MAG: putative lipid II flippase FtsW [Gaiellales bacterium]|jgi:cell division protein FtsW|nr:putative lipid II flippase FtsW [Gaiellales bacterium]